VSPMLRGRLLSPLAFRLLETRVLRGEATVSFGRHRRRCGLASRGEGVNE
jgi:hypothetical protein